MTNKNYIGKGKAQQYGVRISININEAKHFFYEKNGVQYLSFFLNEMQSADKFDNTHTAFVLERNSEPQPEQQAETKPKRNRKSK